MKINTSQLQNKFFPKVDHAVDRHYHGRTAARIKKTFHDNATSKDSFNKKEFYKSIEELTNRNDPRVTAKTISGIKSDFLSSVSDVKSSIKPTERKSVVLNM